MGEEKHIVARPTIRDVAREAKVSIATVSRVINGYEGVSDEIRNRVLAVIERLNYQPDLSARFLSHHRKPFLNDSKYVGVVFGEYVLSDHYFFSSVISGIERTMFESRMNVVIASVANKPVYNVSDLPPFIVEGSLRYVIVIGDVDRDLLLYLRDNGFVVVMVDKIGPTGFDCVLCDYKRGAVQGVEYLIRLGHTKIGLVLGKKEHYFSRALQSGYLKVLQQNGLPIHEEYIACAQDFGPQGGAAALEKFFALSDPPTAIFTNDAIAMGVLQRAEEMGMSVPEKLSVLGFDDIQVARFARPPLTTLKTPGLEMGILAAKLVIDKLRCQNIFVPPQRIELSPILVERESCSSCIQLAKDNIGRRQ